MQTVHECGRQGDRQVERAMRVGRVGGRWAERRIVRQRREEEGREGVRQAVVDGGGRAGKAACEAGRD